MGSQRPKVIRLSESAPPSNFDAVNDELNGNGPKGKVPPPLKLVGSVKERGFSAHLPSPVEVSVPQPRLTPFPVARHRLAGPHLGPTSPPGFPAPAIQVNGGDGGAEMEGAALAEPLRRRKDDSRQASQWRSGRKSQRVVNEQTQNLFDDARPLGSSAETFAGAGKLENQGQWRQYPKAVESGPRAIDAKDILRPEEGANGVLGEKFGPEVGNRNACQADGAAAAEIGRAQGSLLENLDTHSTDAVQLQNRPASLEERGLGFREEQSGLRKHATQSEQKTLTDGDIDAENRLALSAMSSEEIAEAQAELTQKLRPELLELFRRRGAEKERKKLGEKAGAAAKARSISADKKEFIEPASSSLANSATTPLVLEDGRSASKIETGFNNRTIPSDQTASNLVDTVRGTKVGPADLLGAAVTSQQEVPAGLKVEENTPPPPSTDPWTLRVEAVRTMKFDLNGNVVSLGLAVMTEEAFQEAGTAKSQDNVLSVVERDYLRMEGDPLGSGYSLKEALALVRSTVPGQRAIALRLIASVLDKAIHGLLNQKFNQDTVSDCEDIVEGTIDWQAIWAYALGPEAELVLTLRIALDDGHSTVVAACATAIQELLSYSANESYFESLEALWPGDKAVYTAPIFRRKTDKNDGFVGGGRWKYNVTNREMFPFSETSAAEKTEDDENDTVADDGHVSNKDVAAGLIRMGVLPRIRYILEVDKLVAAEEALLSVLLCIARHSPTGANAVMKCPRLIDAVLQRFIRTDGRVSKESWSARVKAIRLLKVLSQVKRSNCVYFEETGAIEMVMRPLLQGYANQPRGHSKDPEQGVNETMIETVRFWRVCIDYGIGVSLFSDCYPMLCSWLLPLSPEEIVGASKDESFLLSIESYTFLEHIARTLSVLHTKLNDSAVAADKTGTLSWSWGVAKAMLDTAMRWLSPERVAGVCVLLEQFMHDCRKHPQKAVVLKSRTRKVIGILAAVLHFLATVCERISSEQELQNALGDPDGSSLPWLPSFVPNLGLVLARSGLLNYPGLGCRSKLPGSEQMHTYLEYVSFCNAQADHDSNLVAINCVNALVRVSSIVDRLIHAAKPKGIASQVDQTQAHKILDHGLLRSSERELRNLLVQCEKDVLSRSCVMQMSVRGGPAPGLGVGWGSFCGGAWSKEVLIAQTSAKLALDLIRIISTYVGPGHSLTEGATVIPEVSGEPGNEIAAFSADPSWRLNLGLAVVATSTPLSRELVRQASSSFIFNGMILSALKQQIEEALVGWRTKRAGARDDCFQGESLVAEDVNLDPNHLSELLVQHFDNFWLAVKETKHKMEVRHGGTSNGKSHSLRQNLATVNEESVEANISHPESLMQEWVRQRLPLPSHWFLSPLAIDLVQSSRTDVESGFNCVSEEIARLEQVRKAGLAFFLGVEVLTSNVRRAGELVNAEVPLVRKIHSLSTVFVSGGDVFLDPVAGDLIGALQTLIGHQIDIKSTNILQHRITSEDHQRGLQDDLCKHGDLLTTAQQDDATCGGSKDTESTNVAKGLMDFEGSIHASYVNYAEIIAEQFVATSFGDLVFARQVALHLWPNVPLMIRLATWRVLTDGQVLELLPPLNECCGPPHLYLYPIEDNQQMLECFVSAWSSGALDKAATRDSLAFTMALHHIAAYLFIQTDSDETALLVKKKTVRTLVRSSVRKLDRHKMLSRLVHYMPGWPHSKCEQTTEEPKVKSMEQLKSRLSFLWEACEGDGSLVLELQRLSG